MQFFFENRTGDCFVTHAWCVVSVFLHDGKFLVKACGIHSLCNYSWKLLAWGIWNSKLVQMFFGTHAVHCLFYLVMVNSSLINWIAFFFVTHACCAISFLLAWWKNLGWGRWTFELVAGELLSLCNNSWKLDWRLLWYARWCLVSVFLQDVKFFIEEAEFWVCAIFLWKSDWGLLCYACMVCSICFLARWKILG